MKVKSRITAILKILSAFIIAGACAVFAALWGYKFYATQQDGTIYYGNISTPQPGIYFAAGTVGDYPVILKKEGEGEWKELYPKTWLLSLWPSQSGYYKLSANSSGTIWLDEIENCSECRFYTYGIYYSHDMGGHWASIPAGYLKPFTLLIFYSSRYGELAVPQDHYEERSDYYHTVDGGDNWVPGSLDDKYKKSEPAGFTGKCPDYFGDDKGKEVPLCRQLN